MKGVRRDVVEIVDPKDENIEKVLVFLKPGCPAAGVKAQEEAARSYADKLVTWRRSLPGAWAWWGAALAVAAAVLAVHWLL